MKEEREDLIPESVALRRGMVIRKDASEHICAAYQPTPLLLDVLLDRRIIGYDHHFYGIQLLTMRKLFLSPVSFRVGMLKIRDEEGAAEAKAVPMEDTDYLRVLREIRNNHWKQIVMEVCTEEPDKPYKAFASHTTWMAFDALSQGVKTVWERKSSIKDA